MYIFCQKCGKLLTPILKALFIKATGVDFNEQICWECDEIMMPFPPDHSFVNCRCQWVPVMDATSRHSCNNCGWDDGQECREPGFPARDWEEYFEGEDCPGWKPRTKREESYDQGKTQIFGVQN